MIERGFDDELAEKAPRQVDRESDKDSLWNIVNSGHDDRARQTVKEPSVCCGGCHPGSPPSYTDSFRRVRLKRYRGHVSGWGKVRTMRTYNTESSAAE